MPGANSPQNDVGWYPLVSIFRGLESGRKLKKGAATDCAKHPQGDSGNRCLSPFSPFSRQFLGTNRLVSPSQATPAGVGALVLEGGTAFLVPLFQNAAPQSEGGLHST